MRRAEREVTSRARITEILDSAKILHLGLFDGNMPYVVPLHYGYEYVEDMLILYMHSAKQGRKLDVMREHPNVCVEMECDVAMISGGDIPCKYGSAFASIIGEGHAEIVEDEKEKCHGLALLMQNQTGKRFDIDKSMADTVAVIKVTVERLSAKENIS